MNSWLAAVISHAVFLALALVLSKDKPHRTILIYLLGGLSMMAFMSLKGVTP